MLYVYAICEAAREPVSGIGLDDRPLECDGYNGITAVFSRHAANVAPSPKSLWQHEQVVESLMRGRTLLPSRFGTMLRDEEALREAIAAHLPMLSAGLERVRGCVELGLRALWPMNRIRSDGQSNGTDHVTGRAYMLARLAEERRRTSIEEEAHYMLDRLHEELSPLARDSTRRRRAAPSSRPALTAAYLVEHEDVERFRRRVQTPRGGHADLRLLCTGPWPPYNFVPALNHAAAASEVRHG